MSHDTKYLIFCTTMIVLALIICLAIGDARV